MQFLWAATTAAARSPATALCCYWDCGFIDGPAWQIRRPIMWSLKADVNRTAYWGSRVDYGRLNLSVCRKNGLNSFSPRSLMSVYWVSRICSVQRVWTRLRWTLWPALIHHGSTWRWRPSSTIFLPFCQHKALFVRRSGTGSSPYTTTLSKIKAPKEFLDTQHDLYMDMEVLLALSRILHTERFLRDPEVIAPKDPVGYNGCFNSQNFNL